MDPSRRLLLVRGLCACALYATARSALARVLPGQLTQLVSPGYKPTDTDERGIWQACDRLEEELAASNLLVRNDALKDYVRGVTERLLGDAAADLRLYIVRNPEFNASMAPNGMTIVHTGLLARMRNEAQLAAVIGHESGHYLLRHAVRNWRDMKKKSATMAVLAIGGAAATGGTGANWYDLANAINIAIMLSLFSFSREMESEADAYGLKLMAAAHYPPSAAAQVWAQFIDERKASAAARKKQYKDKATSIVSTHPPTAERMADLTQSAAELEQAAGNGEHFDDRRAEWLAAVAPVRALLLDEQVKLNDPGASLFLLNSLARDGWDGTLRYFEGETYRLRDEEGDAGRAADSYAAAVRFGDAPPEAYRAHGYAELKAGRVEEGHRALTRYLELEPNAPDAAMVRFTLGQ
jgi:Zn-dependent protease with chaperone function